MSIPFTKMHGIGNDFIVINALEIKLINPQMLARKWCRRRFAVGADQLLLVEKSDTADFKMRIFNADGSEVEMCGNGIRCVAAYIHEKNLSFKTEISIETQAGVMYPVILGHNIKVNMGKPKLSPDQIPFLCEGDKIVSMPFTFSNQTFFITLVSMGNPHCVIFVESLNDYDLSVLGHKIEHDKLFPNRTNVELVEVVNDKHIKVRVWERGTGLTLACGTGACASAVAAKLNRLTQESVTVSLPGGDLSVRWKEGDNVFLTGPAQKVFEGIIEE